MSFRPAPFRHTLLALTIAFAGHTGLAHAEVYQLPSGPLAATLNQIASQAGVTLSIDPALTAGKSSAPVNGDYEAIEALNQALRGTGLQLQSGNGGAYSLAPAAEAAMALPDVTVTASEQAAETAWGPTRGYLANRTATGTKTDTPLLETPRSISVATREQMQDRKVQNLDDAVRYMPGVIASSYGSDSRADWMKIRGFEPIQMLDGLPLPKGSYTMAKLETWNLERVAVLRGPASAVYGQTPPGGLVDAVSRRPQAESSHEVQVQVGNYNHKQISFDSTGKIDDDGRFLYRFSGTGRDSGTTVEHIDDQRFNLAPSLTWNIADTTKLTFLGQFNRDDTGGTSQFLPLQGTKLSTPAGKVDYHKNLGDPDWEFYDKTFYALGYAFEHRINDTWQFNQNLRYSKLELDNQIITAGAGQPPWLTTVRSHAAPTSTTKTSAISPWTTISRRTSTLAPSATPCCWASTTCAWIPITAGCTVLLPAATSFARSTARISAASATRLTRTTTRSVVTQAFTFRTKCRWTTGA